jgi:hypothetical protein
VATGSATTAATRPLGALRHDRMHRAQEVTTRRGTIPPADALALAGV